VAEQAGTGFWTGQFWIADDSKDVMPIQTTTRTTSTVPTQNVNAADIISTTSEGVDDQDITTKRVVRTQTTMPTSTADSAATSHTPSSSTTLLPLPFVTIAEAKVPQNTTATQPSFSTISTLPTTSTVYVAQFSPTTSLGFEATESASFSERHNFSTPGSGAKIAAIGLGAGFGAVVLVVVAIVAMWLLHRRRSSTSRDEDVKLER
jgi:hypothetical protein